MVSKIATGLRNCSVVTATILALVGAQSSLAQVATTTSSGPSFGPNSRDSATQTPIKHVIIIIGENRTFDHVFATYVPVKPYRDTVLNLLSEGIVKADGTPGLNYWKARQSNGWDYGAYHLAPPSTPYLTLPPALAGGPYEPFGCQLLGYGTNPSLPATTDCNTTIPGNPSSNATIIANLMVAGFPVENGLPGPTDLANYYQYLLTGGTGQPANQPDARILYDGHDASHLLPGPFQLTQSQHMPFMAYDAYAQSPVHRLFQMWQELDCSAVSATPTNPSGCKNDLFPWVEVTVGVGSNGAGQGVGNSPTEEGSTAMQFFNVQAGDAPYLKSLADTYTMSDNYHQAVLGGTGANHIMMGTGDAIWFSDGAGHAATPPNNGVNPATPGTPLTGNSSALSEIEDPDPMPGTNNFYTQDGYGGGSGSPTAVAPNGNYGGGAYVNCSDSAQPGVGAVKRYLDALKPSIQTNCQAGHYYLVNNYNPGYFGDGTNAFTDTSTNNTVFTVPPSTVPTIGNELSDAQISWAYFCDQFNLYLNDQYQNIQVDVYCNQCNWAQYNTAIMTNPTMITQHLQDTAILYSGIASGILPAVSWAKPSALVDGHPASSKLILFEGFVKKIVDGVTANPALAKNTAIFVTFDEGGGFYDSGYVQQLDFFGDGSRIPMIVVSPFSEGGHITHSYTDPRLDLEVH